MIVFALVQLTLAAALLWRLVAKEPAMRGSACVLAAAFWCVSVSYPLFAFCRVAFVPAVLDLDAVVPASLLRALLDEGFVACRTALSSPGRFTFRELLALDPKLPRPRRSEG
jgi:hypothetical protein